MNNLQANNTTLTRNIEDITPKTTGGIPSVSVSKEITIENVAATILVNIT
ncbi:unnamed protein product, partial [marine sediment metagenome]